MNTFYRLISEFIYVLPAVLIALVCHEVAHGYVSYRLGDPTPKQTGRLSLNPLRHLDLVGTFCLVIFHFGWAKPVQVNPYYYKNKKWGMALVAIAGPMANMLVAFLGLMGMGAIIRFSGGTATTPVFVIFTLLQYLVTINLGLGTFNLIPFPPLDGSKILGAVLPEQAYFKLMQYERYGYVILLGLLYFGILSKPLQFVTSKLFDGMWYIVQFIF